MPIHSFTTDRLYAHDWTAQLGDRAARRQLETSLAAILTPRVLKHLPEPLQLRSGLCGIGSWIDARVSEADVLLVELQSTRELLGLVILAQGPTAQGILVIHLGYLLSEATWGQGIATELVNGLVQAAKVNRPVRLVGGVDTDNPASARVLEKAGFTLDVTSSTQGSNVFVRSVY